jgi:hypothetical protein
VSGEQSLKNIRMVNFVRFKKILSIMVLLVFILSTNLTFIQSSGDYTIFGFNKVEAAADVYKVIFEQSFTGPYIPSGAGGSGGYWDILTIDNGFSGVKVSNGRDNNIFYPNISSTPISTNYKVTYMIEYCSGSTWNEAYKQISVSNHITSFTYDKSTALFNNAATTYKQQNSYGETVYQPTNCTYRYYCKVEALMPNTSPTIAITSPMANSTYEPVIGSNTITLKGTVNDIDLGDKLTVKYKIDGGATQTVSGTVTTSGAFINTNINIGSLAVGNHNLNVWTEDNYGGASSITTVPFIVEQVTLPSNCKTMIVNIPDTGDTQLQEHSKVITIAKLMQVVSVAVNNGAVDYVVNGDNITINVNNGNIVRTYQSQTITGYQDRYEYGPSYRYASQAQAYVTANPTLNGIPFLCINENYNDETGRSSYQPVYFQANVPIIVYGPMEYYYAYKVTINYVDNYEPSINVITPANNIYSAVAGFDTISLSGTVSDPDTGDILTTKYNIDGGATQTIAGTVTTSGAFNNTSVPVGSLAEGNHTLNVWTEDNRGKSSTASSIPFKIDKTLPVIGTVSINTSESSVNVSGTATDIINLHIQPYQYTVGSNTPSGWTTSTSYTQNQLIPNTLYAVKFESRDKGANIATKVQNVYTKATKPIISVGNPTSTSLKINMLDNNSPETLYQISINNGSKYVTPEGTLTTSPVWLTLSSKNMVANGFAPDTAYSFKVKAKNADGIETEDSSPVSATTLVLPPVAPVNVTATATNKSVTVVWDPVVGSTGYEIEADGKIVDAGTYTSYIHSGLTPYTQHIYKVRARNAGGQGAWSEQISKYTEQENPNSPFNIDAAANNTSIIVTWKPIPGATAYDIEVDGVVINNSSSTSYVHSGLIPGTMHSYRVRSINSTGKSEWSNEMLISTQISAPSVPGNFKTFASGDTVTVTWDEVQGSTYEIEVDGNIRDNGTNNIFVHSGLASGSTHMYRVRTKLAGSLSNWSSFVTVTLPLSEFGTPSNIKAEATDNSIALSWNPVVNAIGYDVDVNGLVTDNGTEASCLFSTLTSNTQYIYRVRARAINKVSEWSEYKPVMTYALPTPTNLMTIASGDTVSITWNGVEGAESYDLDIDGQVIPEITSIPYVHPGLDLNSQHLYKVRAKNTLGFSAWSKVFVDIPQSGGSNAPIGIIAKSLTNSIQIMWKPMTDAMTYDVEVDGNILQGITSTNYTHTGLGPGTQHSYRVRAIINGVKSDWSNTSIVMTLPIVPPSPTNVAASSTTSSVLVTWDKIEDATEYELEVDGAIVSTGTGTKYLHSNLAPDSSHTYRVRARSVSDWSLWSEAVTIKTKSAVQTYDMQSVTGQVFNLVVTANDIKDPSKYTYTITYNAEDLEVLDLCAATSRIDMAIGNVIGTDIQIVQYTPGTIVFKKLGTSSGQTWTGQINSIKFKSKTDNTTQVIYSFE